MKTLSILITATFITSAVYADFAVTPFTGSGFILGDTTQYIVATNDLGFTGLANVPATGGRGGSMVVVAGALVAITNPIGMNFSDNATWRLLTNGQSAKIQVEVIAGICTNTTIIFYPGAPFVASASPGGGTNNGTSGTNNGTSVTVTDPLWATNRPDLLWYPFTNNAYLNAPTNGTVVLIDHSIMGGLDGDFYQEQARPWAPDPFGTTNAGHWSGAITILTVPGSAPWLNFTNQNRTLAFWIYPETFNWPILGNVDSHGNGYYLACSSQGSLVVNSCNNGVISSIGETSPSLDSRSWTHVTVLFNGGTNITLWINGIPDPTQTGGAVSPMGLSTADFQVGYTNSTSDMDGNIFNIEMWSYLRTPVQIEADYLHATDVTNSLIAWYKGSGNANDSTGKGHNGVWSTTPSYTTNSEGVANSAFSFNGGASIDTGLVCNSAEFPHGYTLNFWALAQGSGARDPIGDINSDCSAGMVGPIDLSGTFFNRSFLPAQTDVNGGTWLNDNWYMVTVYCDNTRMQIYTNGVPVNTALAGASGNIKPGTTLKLGRWGDFQWQGVYSYFTGQISDVRLFTNALPNPAISLLYANGPEH